jgi:dTDP-4-amino-4,6-dideoxygalactose transaminase
LGSIGHLAAFSFHETKNIISGEGGMLTVNDMSFAERAEIIWEKGTNRSAFYRGEVDKYGWVDIGSSFLPSEMVAAFLWAQLEALDDIQKMRLNIWNNYHQGLAAWADASGVIRPQLPGFATNNAHMYYLVFPSLQERTAAIKRLKESEISAVFHYLSLHKSPFFADKHDGRELPLTDHYSDSLLRLPFYNELTDVEQESIIKALNNIH